MVCRRSNDLIFAFFNFPSLWSVRVSSARDPFVFHGQLNKSFACVVISKLFVFRSCPPSPSSPPPQQYTHTHTHLLNKCYDITFYLSLKNLVRVSILIQANKISTNHRGKKETINNYVQKKAATK